MAKFAAFAVKGYFHKTLANFPIFKDFKWKFITFSIDWFIWCCIYANISPRNGGSFVPLLSLCMRLFVVLWKRLPHFSPINCSKIVNITLARLLNDVSMSFHFTNDFVRYFRKIFYRGSRTMIYKIYVFWNLHGVLLEYWVCVLFMNWIVIDCISMAFDQESPLTFSEGR